ncbi:MAG TPA: thymidine phosphorylase [Chthonomonadales bacterium]|nr:thymidine phosphorylase [Chthonomonadales bacterium]
MRPYDWIAKKRDGVEHTCEEIACLVRAVVDGAMPDYQVAAWLMAVYLRGLTKAETLALTLAMRDSGETIRLEDVPDIKLDKHSTGGVGDKTSLVVVPLLAAAGVPILKMSGRGLGFSGGTIDKLEAIPGLRTDLSIEAARAQVKRIGAALIGQTPALVPADKKLYALRDVTATVESIPLIAASIMSKKLATGADVVLLDVKVGRGAFMKSLDQARALAETMVEIGRGAGIRTVAFLTDMEEPLGYAVGNALEVAEACELLTGAGRVDSRFCDLCLALAAHGLVLAGKSPDEQTARTLLESILHTGGAAQKWEQIIAAQGGKAEVVRNTGLLPTAGVVTSIYAETGGYLTSMDAEAIGRLAVEMGAGRTRKEDTIDPAVGILLHKKTGDAVARGEPLAELHCSVATTEEDLTRYSAMFRAAIAITHSQPPPRPIIHAIIE